MWSIPKIQLILLLRLLQFLLRMRQVRLHNLHLFRPSGQSPTKLQTKLFSFLLWSSLCLVSSNIFSFDDVPTVNLVFVISQMTWGILSSSLAAKYRLTDRIMINKRTRRTNYWRCDSVMTSVWRLLWNPYDTISDNFHSNPVRSSRQSKIAILGKKLEWENTARINVVWSLDRC